MQQSRLFPFIEPARKLPRLRDRGMVPVTQGEVAVKPVAPGYPPDFNPRSFIKMRQNTPQLCWGDEWPALSPGGRGLG